MAGLNAQGAIIAIVILNWNGIEDTRIAVRSALGQKGHNNIIVVDNGSEGDDADLLENEFRDIEVIRSSANLGFAGGCNLGIRRALDRDATHILLLNNDALFGESDTVVRMVERLDSLPRTAALGPKIVYSTSPDVVWFAGGEVNRRTSKTRQTGMNQRASDFQGLVPTQYVTGCALLSPAAAYRDVGLLDDSYFLYFEETDWNLRAQRRGWKSFVDRDIVVLHNASQTMRRAGDVQYYYFLKSRLLFAKRWSGWAYYAIVLPMILLHSAAVVLYNAARGRRRRAGHVVRALKDYFRGARGPLTTTDL